MSEVIGKDWVDEVQRRMGKYGETVACTNCGRTDVLDTNRRQYFDENRRIFCSSLCMKLYNTDEPKPKNQYNPDYAVHPGDHIVEHLRRYDKFWHLSVDRKSWLLGLITGKTTIMGIDALELAELFGTSEELWINLQKQWDERKK